MYKPGFISGTFKTPIPDANPYTPNVLIDAGHDFHPSQVQTARLLEFEKMTKGGAYDWNLNNIVGVTSTYPAQPKPDGATLDIPDFDWATIALQFLEAGAQYCILTVTTGFGFSLFDQKTTWPLAQAIVTGTGTFAENWPAGVRIPFYDKWDVEQSGNGDVFKKFCYEMRRVGIEPIVYAPIHGDINRIAGIFTDGAPSPIIDAFMHYFCCWVQELIIRYGVKYFWLDGTNFIDNATSHFTQKIYNAIKSVTGQNNPNECLLIGNSFPGTQATSWPFDIRAFEYFIYNNDPSIFNKTLNINGTDYYVPVNVVECCAENNYYYNIKAGLDGHQPLSNNSHSFLQAEYDLVKQYGSTYCLFLQPDYLGNMLTDQLELLQNLT